MQINVVEYKDLVEQCENQMTCKTQQTAAQCTVMFTLSSRIISSYEVFGTTVVVVVVLLPRNGASFGNRSRGCGILFQHKHDVVVYVYII